MKTLKIILGALIVLCIWQHGRAQDEPTAWPKIDRSNMKPLEYQYQREADVFWSKNIWRIIDTREKMNQPFQYPREPLIQIIHEAAKKGEITVYDPMDGDRFATVMNVREVIKMGTHIDTSIQVKPENPDEDTAVVIKTELRWTQIKKYRIKEVWFFDANTSTMRVRILAIAPVMEDYDENGTYRGDMTMYWVAYADLRNMLAKHEVFNAQNDSQHISWEDLFEMRMFESYIYKESNVFDRSIQEYASGADAQLESEKIKQQLFEKEHDLWDY